MEAASPSLETTRRCSPDAACITRSPPLLRIGAVMSLLASTEFLPSTDRTAPVLIARIAIVCVTTAVGLMLLLLFVVRTDVVVQGKVVLTPEGESARVQSRQAGTVARLNVHDGDH